MALNDLLVSYKRIETPSRTIPEFKFPESYQLVTSDAPQSKPDQEDVQTPKYYTSTVQRPKFSSIQRWNSPYRDRNAWITDLAAAYRKAGVTNDNAIKMLIAQDAQESGWGRSAQGKFNFGNLTTGAKWKGDYVMGNDHDAKGNPIKQKFRSYNSMDEYAVDKLQFLKHLYDFDENDDINTFTAKLTGKNKGKRRYAEATDYADRVAAVFRSFKNGGVIKAQAGTIVADNTRVVKPIIQEIVPRTYQISEQPQFVQDNRSDWERQQSDNYKRQQQENKTLYNNQHLWNWSAPFNNTRVTKDNAKAMFDFNKSAGMSTFAVGMGIANPVATAPSMAGSMVGAGIGNEVAGEKGSIVGGLVGGLFGFSPKRVGNSISKEIGQDYTERLIKLLGKKKEAVTGEVQHNDMTRAFAKYLKEQGVDISKFSNRDLLNLMTERYLSVTGNLPKQKAATLNISETSDSKKYGFMLYNESGEELGNLSLSGRKDNSLDVENIRSTGIQRGVSQDLYDAAIRYSRDLGGKGVISGKTLLSPEQTYSVWKKYPDKQIISQTGERTFNSGENVRKTGERYKIYDGPIVRLQSPSKHEEVPVKSSNIFHPSMIDKETGKLNPPDWGNKDIFKLGIPVVWGLSQIGNDNGK